MNNSNNIPIAPLRKDIAINLVVEDGEELLVMNDPLSIASHPLVITYEFYLFLQNFDGEITRDDIQAQANIEMSAEVDLSPLFSEIDTLDKLLYLENEHYFNRKHELEEQLSRIPVRPPISTGGSYPDNEQELTQYLGNIFSTVDKSEIEPNANSIVVPHIDFRIGEEAHKVYASAYHALRNTDSDLFVIFGTAHHANSARFMLTKRNYSSPLGVINTDAQLLSYLDDNCRDTFKYDEFAHQPEHSIEFQIVLLQHYFKDRNFQVLPVLVGSFYDHIMSGTKPESDEAYSAFIEKLNEGISKLGRKAAFIASVDFSHVGKRFGDNFNAESVLDEIRSEDSQLVKSIENLDADAFLGKISSDNDKWKICGTAPIYSMLKANHFDSGKLLRYGQWNDTATQSAVSFASMALIATNHKK